MSRKREPYLQHICTSKPYCKCVGPNEWDECGCIRNDRTGICKTCLAPMKLIDFATGEAPLS